jgi:hypothetical protein
MRTISSGDCVKDFSLQLLDQAVKDWSLYHNCVERMSSDYRSASATAWQNAIVQGFVSPRDDMITFFNGGWFVTLCDYIDVDADKLRSALSVPGTTDFPDSILIDFDLGDYTAPTIEDEMSRVK